MTLCDCVNSIFRHQSCIKRHWMHSTAYMWLSSEAIITFSSISLKNHFSFSGHDFSCVHMLHTDVSVREFYELKNFHSDQWILLDKFSQGSPYSTIHGGPDHSTGKKSMNSNQITKSLSNFSSDCSTRQSAESVQLLNMNTNIASLFATTFICNNELTWLLVECDYHIRNSAIKIYFYVQRPIPINDCSP